MKRAYCIDCGRDYDDFGLDITLPNAQWVTLCPEDGLLCGTCIAKRSEKIEGVIGIRAVLENRLSNPDIIKQAVIEGAKDQNETLSKK